jgi:hypothetical protein
VPIRTSEWEKPAGCVRRGRRVAGTPACRLKGSIPSPSMCSSGGRWGRVGTRSCSTGRARPPSEGEGYVGAPCLAAIARAVTPGPVDALAQADRAPSGRPTDVMEYTADSSVGETRPRQVQDPRTRCRGTRAGIGSDVTRSRAGRRPRREPPSGGTWTIVSSPVGPSSPRSGSPRRPIRGTLGRVRRCLGLGLEGNQ